MLHTINGTDPPSQRPIHRALKDPGSPLERGDSCILHYPPILKIVLEPTMTNRALLGAIRACGYQSPCIMLTDWCHIKGNQGKAKIQGTLWLVHGDYTLFSPMRPRVRSPYKEPFPLPAACGVSSGFPPKHKTKPKLKAQLSVATKKLEIAYTIQNSSQLSNREPSDNSAITATVWCSPLSEAFRLPNFRETMMGHISGPHIMQPMARNGPHKS
ncbi:hypothetical protein DPMN_133214 [Dreissena polymorpha]|uniref:Uncharacterized protein n=1 Tax=Dreissena polymorpha TaxID=45954 RepID=A0A9D4J9K0_DREPO|nr:hypothetical protein DPMN_133214 [Dreissena polymorpha]